MSELEKKKKYIIDFIERLWFGSAQTPHPGEASDVITCLLDVYDDENQRVALNYIMQWRKKKVENELNDIKMIADPLFQENEALQAFLKGLKQ